MKKYFLLITILMFSFSFGQSLFLTENPVHDDDHATYWSKDKLSEIQIHKNHIDVFVNRRVVLRKYSMNLPNKALAYIIDAKGKRYKLITYWEKINNKYVEQTYGYQERVRKRSDSEGLNSMRSFSFRFEKIDPGVEIISIEFEEGESSSPEIDRFNNVQIKNPANKVNFDFPENTGYNLSSLREYLLLESNDPLEGIYTYKYASGDSFQMAIIKTKDNRYSEIALQDYKKEYIDPISCSRFLSRNVRTGDVDGYFEKSTTGTSYITWYSYSNHFLDDTKKKLMMNKSLILFDDMKYKKGNSVNVSKLGTLSLYKNCDGIVEIKNRLLETKLTVEKIFPEKEYASVKSPNNDSIKKPVIKVKPKPKSNKPEKGVKID